MRVNLKWMLVLVFTVCLSCNLSYADGTLRVGVYQDKPILFQNEQGEADGFAVDVLEAYAESRNLDIEYHYGSLKECFDLLEKGEIDILPDVIRTDERSQAMAFSKSFLIINWGVLVTHEDVDVDSIQQMDGIQVAVVKADHDSGEFIKMISDFDLDVSYLEVETYEEALRLVERKIVDGGIVNRTYLEHVGNQYKIQETPIVFNPSEIRYAFKKELPEAFIKDMDASIQEMKETSTSLYYSAFERWFYINEESDMQKRYMIIFLVVFASAAGLWILFVRTKKSELRKERALNKTMEELEQESIKLRRNEDRIYTMAYYDELTDLENRTSLYRDLSDMCDLDDSFALVFFDLDNFKEVNDALGYLQGDVMIKKVADRLKSFMSEHNNLYRWGGDEFAFICFDYTEQEQVETFAQNILKAFESSIAIEGMEFYLTASVGVTYFMNNGETHQEMIRQATVALHEVKKNGKNDALTYSTELSERMIRKIELSNQIRDAIRGKEFVVYYQPRVDVRKGDIAGMEALVRWVHPAEGMVSPGEFIPLAEETGLIREIDYIVMEKACRDTKAWNDSGFPINVSLNLSAKHFEDDTLLSRIDELLENTGVNPAHVEFEITESAILEDIDFAIALIGEIKAMGFKVLLDDFGTGYSSLNHLKRIPLDILKIDKTFMDKVMEDSKEKTITESVIQLAHSLGLQVVAEGVEHESQLEFLKDHRCDEFQGYYFSKPVPALEFEQLLKIDRTA